MPRVPIDRERLRNALEDQSPRDLLEIALALFDQVPKTRRAAALGPWISVPEIRVQALRPSGVLEEVRLLHDRSLLGAYFESFRVDSKNYMDKSEGTRRFIKDYVRLAEATAVVATAGAHEEACEAFALLADLYARIDDCEDIIFLADEHGAFQVGASWHQLLPAWFAALAATCDPEAFAEQVVGTIEVLHPYGVEDLLVAAQQIASPAQDRALQRAAASLSA